MAFDLHRYFPGIAEFGSPESCSSKPMRGSIMKVAQVTVPELAMLAGTRVALGAGLALLHADCFSEEQRKTVGWLLFGIGALSTIPLALEIFGGQHLAATSNGDGQIGPTSARPAMAPVR
jgi:hypothetical protein